MSHAAELLTAFRSKMRLSSRQARRHAVADYIRLLIQSGVEFDQDDGAAIAGLYSEAVMAKNGSAYRAIEAHLGRKRFCFRPSIIRGHITMQNPPRLIVGAWFYWDSEPVSVTSFNDKQGTLTACAYAPVSRKVTRRLVITPDALAQEEERYSEWKRLKSAVEKLETDKRMIARKVANVLRGETS